MSIIVDKYTVFFFVISAFGVSDVLQFQQFLNNRVQKLTIFKTSYVLKIVNIHDDFHSF